jgi:2-polyprenyl-3-methyl-5-hydroxy-6-metoxy-1,4-benzoquinol methylase
LTTVNSQVTQSVPCPLCGSDSKKVLCRYGQVAVVRCKACGFVYDSPRLAGPSLAEYYRDHYYRPSDLTDPARLEKRFRRDRPVWEKVLEQIETACPRRGRLLDVGCGPGYFVKVAAERGWASAGVDSNEIAVQFGRDRWGLDLRCGAAADMLPGDAGRFDAVSYLQVLEHTSDPVAELTAANALLHAGGVLLVSVPNFDYVGVKLRRCRHFNLMNLSHMHHFTATSLDRALKAAGFAPRRRLVWWGAGRSGLGSGGLLVQWVLRLAGMSSELRVVSIKPAGSREGVSGTDPIDRARRRKK